MCCKGHKEMLLYLELFSMKTKLYVQPVVSFQLCVIHVTGWRDV